MFPKVAPLEISRGPLLTGVAGLQYKVCNATKTNSKSSFLKRIVFQKQKNTKNKSTTLPGKFIN